ncbi:homoserine kinase [Chitinophaga caeni]|uniref:Homoserine kinase n=1 Tax=Chitinophaga caeni TaxID=2029983 RepID=A0A291QWV4_9BACT|nr:homoserine kinase [Chitinophaga caeni]ATL48509.1 homoserine kinase [Chitinophaga caeni]
MNRIKVFSPATVANVACGFDVIGLALDNPGDEIEMWLSSEPGIRIREIHGADLPLEPSKNVCGVALQALVKKLPDPLNAGFEMIIKKNIQPGSGIGSSAASAAGAVVAANILLGEPFPKKKLVRFAMEGERLASGSAHADNVAPAILGGFTLVRSYTPVDIVGLPTPPGLWVTVIHPQIEVKTSDAREILKHKVLMTDAIKQWGNVAALVAGLYRNDYGLIGRSLEDVIVEPVRSILIPAFQELKIKCKEAGALGGGISGSGPSVFMLSTSEEIARNVADVMNNIYQPLGLEYHIHVSTVNQEGVKVISR